MREPKPNKSYNCFIDLDQYIISYKELLIDFFDQIPPFHHILTLKNLKYIDCDTFVEKLHESDLYKSGIDHISYCTSSGSEDFFRSGYDFNDEFGNLLPKNDKDIIVDEAFFLIKNKKLAIKIITGGRNPSDLICYIYHYDYRTIKENVDLINNFLKTVVTNKEDSPKINYICYDRTLHLKSMDIKKIPSLSLEDNYNDDFIEVYEKLLEYLNDSSKEGLALLHGIPGTGKTSFLRYLFSQLDKKVIYVPPNMTERISDPSFFNFMLKHPNSILIVEDSESILRSREGGSNDAVSNLLNMTDGILGDALNLKVICTFNMGLQFIDEALMRKGRLFCNYEFKPLKAEKANKLFKKLNPESNIKIDKDMSLSHLYNMNETEINNFLVENKVNNSVSFGFQPNK